MLPHSGPFLIPNSYFLVPMLEALVTRRGEALRSCLRHCGSKKQLLPHCFRSTESTVSRPRCLFATSCRQLAKVKWTGPVKKITPKHQVYASYIDTLKLRDHPTLLYQSSSHLGYLIGCYTLGGFCFGYSIVNFKSYYLNPPEGVWAPIPKFIGCVCVLMVGIGIFFCRRVSSIHGVNSD